VDHLNSCGTRLLGPASVQFNAVPQDTFVGGDFSERSTIPDARIERATLFVRECQESQDPFRLRKRQWIKTEAGPSSQSHRNLLLVVFI
jgi:hypothetical protein